MSEQNRLNCQQSKDQLDSLIEAMVEAKLNPEANQSQKALNSSFDSFFESGLEPQGALKEHLADCSECHNYQLANRVIIEAARALPRLQGDEDLTQSILAAIEISQNEKSEEIVRVPAAVPSVFTLRSSYLLVASFVAFTLTTSGFTPEGLWSAGSWALALIVVAMLKPLIEGNLTLTNTNSMAKA